MELAKSFLNVQSAIMMEKSTSMDATTDTLPAGFAVVQASNLDVDNIGEAGAAYRFNLADEVTKGNAPAGSGVDNNLGFWFVHLPTAHPMLHWYVYSIDKAPSVPGVRTNYTVLLMAIDPETYIETPMDPSDIKRAVEYPPAEIDRMFNAKNPAHATDAGLMVLKGLVTGALLPDRETVAMWDSAIAWSVEQSEPRQNLETEITGA